MKQVIVLRKDLNMRKGKMVAQGGHAVLGSFSEAKRRETQKWLEEGQTKICVSVNSEAELLDIYQKACKAELPCALVRDSGLTEFNGVPTLTAVGIGPAEDSEIDKITGDLKLL